MLKSLFIIAWRNLRKNRTYATINMLGLSMGIACGLIIFALVRYHLSFDDFHPAKDRIYRVVTEFHDEVADFSQGVPSPLGKAFRKDFDYSESVAREVGFNNSLVTFSDGGTVRKFKEEKGVVYAEPAFFD